MRITLFLHNWAKRALNFFLLSLHFVFSYVYLCVDYVSRLLGYQEVAWENSRHLARLPPVSPPNDVWETSAEIPYWWRVTTKISVVLLIGWIKFPTLHDQSEALPRSGWWRVISMEFLRSFLRRHLAGKPVVASQNVGCFLWLAKNPRTTLPY